MKELDLVSRYSDSIVKVRNYLDKVVRDEGFSISDGAYNNYITNMRVGDSLVLKSALLSDGVRAYKTATVLARLYSIITFIYTNTIMYVKVIDEHKLLLDAPAIKSNTIYIYRGFSVRTNIQNEKRMSFLYSVLSSNSIFLASVDDESTLQACKKNKSQKSSLDILLDMIENTTFKIKLEGN